MEGTNAYALHRPISRDVVGQSKSGNAPDRVSLMVADAVDIYQRFNTLRPIYAGAGATSTVDVTL